LAPSLKKHHQSAQDVLTLAYAKKSSLKELQHSILQKNHVSSSQSSDYNTLTFKGYYFHDSAEITFKTADLFYKTKNIFHNTAFGIDTGVVSLEKKNQGKYTGYRYGFSVYWKHLMLRLGANHFKDFSEFVPQISYTNSYKKHNYLIDYKYQNSLFYTYALKSYEKRIKAHHISVSDYISLERQSDLWASLEYNIFSNSDKELTLQYDWRFYYNQLFDESFSYYIALEGWYTSHTKQHTDFYSPSFSDTTIIRIDPQYIFSKYIGIKAKAGIGYSFKDKTVAYKYGIWLFGNPINNLSYNAGCLYSNSAKVSSGTSYNYEECKLNLEYQW